MKAIALTISALSLAALAGCSSFANNDITGVQPTAQSVKDAGGSQIYRGMEFFASDFNADGSARTLEQYDLTKESAPCTVVGDVWSLNGQNRFGQSASAEINGASVVLNCRRPNVGTGPDGARLFLLGSSYDCVSRAGFSGSGYTSTAVREFDRSCASHRLSSGGETATDRAYLGKKS